MINENALNTQICSFVTSNNLLRIEIPHLNLPSTRKQKTKEKRSRQSDVLSDIENLDVLLGSYQRDNSEMQDRTSENGIDLESNRRDDSSNHNENDYRTYLKTKNSENSGMTVETSRAISSEISLQMSRKLEEMQTNLNSHILDAINAVIEGKVLPSIKNAVKIENSVKSTNLDLRSDGPHPSNSSQARPQVDLQSNGLQPESVSQVAEDVQNDFPRLVTMKGNRKYHCRENSIDSNQSDDYDGYDRTGTNIARVFYCNV